VWVPEGLHLLVDIPSTPVLNAVVVEGSLVFQSDQVCDFDASYIFVNSGKLQAGSESQPVSSNLTITLHGEKSDPYLPIYGNKVLAARSGEVDLHGAVRQPTWTVLQRTAEIGATRITLKGEVDWRAGEWIAIASTSYDGTEAEKRQIIAIDRRIPVKPILTLNEPLAFRHLGTTDYLGGAGRPNDFVEMRAEVALLTRNIVLQGVGAANYGATFFADSSSDSGPLSVRLSGIEFRQVGQAYMQDRSPLLMKGTFTNSFVKGVSVHDSSNRMIVLHQAKGLLLQDNVGFNIKGHAIVLTDRQSTDNTLEGNCLIDIRRSMSLLNAD